MDKLSDLLQEAKPLYRRKKRQKAMIRACCIMFIPMFALIGANQLCNAGNDLYLSLENQTLQQELIEDNMGLLR